VIFIPKGKQNKRYTGKFKQMVIETMHRKKLSHKEVERQFEITSHSCVPSWERIYLTEGSKAPFHAPAAFLASCLYISMPLLFYP